MVKCNIALSLLSGGRLGRTLIAYLSRSVSLIGEADLFGVKADSRVASEGRGFGGGPPGDGGEPP